MNDNIEFDKNKPRLNLSPNAGQLHPPVDLFRSPSPNKKAKKLAPVYFT
jgi:hypothetical protein